MCIRLHGLDRVRRVMDPFAGLGHTALACKELKVPFTGFEIDEQYFAEACDLIRSDISDGSEEGQSPQLYLFEDG